MKGISFGTIHSYNDLHLILAPFTPSPAKPQTNFLKVTGRDGYLDLTEANGEVKFNSRDFTFKFTIAPDDEMTFDERVSFVSSLLNGLQCKITLDRDPDYYWFGRCVVDKYTQNKIIGEITVKATVDPYKLKQSATVVSVALSSDEQPEQTSQTVELENSRMAAIPTIECTDDGVIATFGETAYTLESGKNRILDIRFVEGNNEITLTGTGAVTITWQEGVL